MKVLTVAQMNTVDRETIGRGIPGIILMENAAHRVVEYIAERFAPVRDQRIVVFCGKGNNGGDGLAIARILYTRFQPASLEVVLAEDPAEAGLKMLQAAGVQTQRVPTPQSRNATLVIDAVLGTGLNGPARGPALDAIRAINSEFPLAKVVAVDIPSGLAGDSATPVGEYVRAFATVTFTAPKICHALPPARGLMGDLRIASIGSPAALLNESELELITPQGIASIFAPRDRDSNKGRYGHVLVIAGSHGKSGAAVMAGTAALRAGAGLVTVACPESVLAAVSAYTPELMTETLTDRIYELAAKLTLTAIGPGIGTADETRDMVRTLFATLDKPMVVDADALNCLAGTEWKKPPAPRILTPHPGEMSRLTGLTIPQVQADRIGVARAFATERGVTLVLKGEGTVIAFPDGRVWINTTGSPAMATGGTGDILTGMTAGLAGQFPKDLDRAVAAAVYVHGLSGELAAQHLCEQSVIAMNLLHYLPEGIRAITNFSH
jgi:ADP-dependent NAD(P)H-hydrate dehydratase / NAD(P)H-hydrate epimerase